MGPSHDAKSSARPSARPAARPTARVPRPAKPAVVSVATPNPGEPESADWTTSDASKLYRVDQWGEGYFSVNDNGCLSVQPHKTASPAIDLKKLVDELKERDLQPPLLIRFSDILRHRVGDLNAAFQNAIREHDYESDYHCVYPIKVNQQRHVVEEVIEFGRPYGFGVEVGSKPELLAVMAMVKDDTTPIICNGFKDASFIEAVILAAKIGKNIIPVVEKFSELELITRFAKLHNVRPSIGVRAKLAARGAGRWEQSGGIHSKFGLFVSEVIDALEFLKQHEMTDCLKLLHFHLGSQISDIRSIKSAVIELSRIYAELRNAGAGLEYVDVGGGLGVDYDGSNTNTVSSINYTLQEYANNIVFHIKETCDDAGVPHPTIISESGRALVAHHSVLVVEVIGWSGFGRVSVPQSLSDADRADMPLPVVTLFDAYADLTTENYTEYFHDAQLARDQALTLFNTGHCSLAHRGLAERLFFGVCTKVLSIVRELDDPPIEFLDLEAILSDTYTCNYSIFQSMPDSWAIDQNFPIMPIHRLDEQPTCRGTLADISCDSDGKIDRFIGGHRPKPVLELHPYNDDEPYYMGAFLVGAYQEILGDLHNLFGDTNAVHVSLDDAGRVCIDEIVEGDTVREVLSYVQYSADELTRAMRKRVDQALRDGKLTLEESRVLLRFYESGLKGYTYLE